MKRRRRAKPAVVKPGEPVPVLSLYRVTFSCSVPDVEVLVLATSAEEAENLAEEPDSFDVDIDWDASAEEPLDREQTAREIKTRGADEEIGEHPVTGNTITLGEWAENFEAIAAAARAQAEFDALMGDCLVCGRIRINCKGHTPSEYEAAEARAGEAYAALVKACDKYGIDPVTLKAKKEKT